MRIKIPVKIKDYKSYIESNGNPYLDKNYLLVADKSKSYITDRIFGKVDEEIFNGIDTKYTSSTSNNKDFLIKFISNSGSEYRMDILKEPNSNIYHISFSLFGNIKYDEMTNKVESIEVFNRLIWILRDFVHNINVDKFCIGGTGTPKDNIYKYIMNKVSWWEKRDCTEYELGWAIYFKI